jgi:hypothetical protein
MWKTLGGFWAQMTPFAYILPPETDHIHCAAAGLALFRRPNVNQLLLEDARSLHFIPTFIWGLYLTTKTTSGTWIT